MAVVLTVHARSADGATSGNYATGIERLTFRTERNAPGGWQLVAPPDHPLIALIDSPAAGLVVQRNGAVVFAGPPTPAGPTVIASTRVTTATRDAVTITGTDDLGILWRRLVYPPPGRVDAAHWAPTFGEAAAALVSGQLVAPDVPARTLARFGVAANPVGDPTTLRGRYDVLGDVLAAAMPTGLVMTVTTSADGSMVFGVTAETPVGLGLSIEAGTATTITRTAGAASPTVAVALADGDGVNRLAVEAADLDTSAWSRVETVFDRGDIADRDELLAAAVAAVDVGGVAYVVELTSALTGSLTVGQSVTLTTPDAAALPVPVTSTETTVTAAATRSTVTVGAATVTPADRLAAIVRADTRNARRPPIT